ncbi:hypothetical protein A9G13_02130 [Gilliamella sp. wkB178]|uniref:DUF3892 domain-containing protein n=1 Tax=Gilliamella sp. wkB178 TaxID=3120259 RepID=UPI00080E5104|nr:DUF3892 domain-containing protein [Gilliamella apicola]OCG08882.1 hypothetical protein A9G13_02130 [Gilliamella apicola]
MGHRWKDIDFVITGVKIDNGKISLVKVRNVYNLGANIGSEKKVPRKFIVDLLKLKNKNKHIIFYTSTFDEMEDGWNLGDEVTLYNDEFITTNGNRTTKDNLGNLPEFK